MTRDLWSLDEYIAVADLYIRRGRSSGVRDPEVLELAQLTGRSPASISRRLGNFDGTVRPDRGLKPVTGLALEAFQRMLADAALRSEMVSEARSRLAHLVRTARTTVTASLVKPESNWTETADVITPAESHRLERREARLVEDYRMWLDPTDDRLRGILIFGVAEKALRVDLYDVHLKLLIEAKAEPTRSHMRHAVGQLIDYQRYLTPPPDMAILVGDTPSDDLLRLPAAVGIGVIWRVKDSFQDSEDGSLTVRLDSSIRSGAEKM